MARKHLPEPEDANSRFGIRPEYRLTGIAFMTSIFGVFDGFYRGFTSQSLVYLAENSHRLPKTVGGWYFYHKRKNYVCITNGIVNGTKLSAKLTLAVTGYFTLEAMLDEARDKVDFINTLATSGIAALGYSKLKNFGSYQTKQIIKKGMIVGMISGLAQDLYIWTRGGKVWYLDQLGTAKLNRDVKLT